jgi:protein O-GlcNAcase/histone acetyltransferase
MPASSEQPFLAGVIEGFYGPPWSRAERLELFGWMGRWGLDTYFYGPKDDLNQRAVWREPYSEAAEAELRELIALCSERGIRFIYALSPGLDITYTSETDVAALHRRFDRMLELGCRDFCLLWDDIPDAMHPADLERFGSLAGAQSAITNAVFRRTRALTGGRFLFCPTPYCGRMVAAKHGGHGYLETVGRELDSGIDVFWTGPEIISETINVDHVSALAETLRRPPLIWDNLHANDYDGRRFFCGPYAGRPPELRAAVRGILVNPNTEFPLNYVPLRTFGAFVHSAGAWDARAEYLTALDDWAFCFATVGAKVDPDGLRLFADCNYLPYEDGETACELFEKIRALLATDPESWGAESAVVGAAIKRLQDFCGRMAEMKDRGLFYAMHRRVWELREELDLLHRFISFRSDPANRTRRFQSDFHRPKTYRGGFVARLQELLEPSADGSFQAAGIRKHEIAAGVST